MNLRRPMCFLGRAACCALGLCKSGSFPAGLQAIQILTRCAKTPLPHRPRRRLCKCKVRGSTVHAKRGMRQRLHSRSRAGTRPRALRKIDYRLPCGQLCSVRRGRAAAVTLQPAWQRLQVAPGWSHLGINEVQGRRIGEYLNEGSNHFLLSDGADAFHSSNVIWNQQHCLVMHGGNKLRRYRGRCCSHSVVEPSKPRDPAI